jgi:hypothetical protein
MRKKLTLIILVLLVIIISYALLLDSNVIVHVHNNAGQPLSDVRLTNEQEKTFESTLIAEQSVQTFVFDDIIGEDSIEIKYTINGVVASTSLYVESGYEVDVHVDKNEVTADYNY